MPEPVAIGVDAGGTKTHIRVQRADTIERDAVVATAQWWASGTAIDDAANVVRLVGCLALTPADAADPRSALVLGAHGVDSQRAADGLQKRLAEHLAGAIRVVNDGVLAGPAAGYLGASITIIAGTGSIVLAVTGDGRVLRRGGHGHLLGDEGSAPALVRDVADGVLRAADSGTPDAVALAALAEAANVPDGPDRANDLATALHLAPGRTDWGALAPAVFSAADAGSPVASRVIREHAAELARLVEAHIADGVVPEGVVLAGGVVTQQRRLADAIAAALHAAHPGLPVVLLDGPPVEGAVTLAQAHLATSAPRTTASAS